MFTDCLVAVISAFNNSIPRNTTDMILQIKYFISKLAGSNNETEVHWVAGHKDIGVIS